ncbi:MAG TPA: SpoIIE family protein phosphatase [Bacteroidia bacterium]|nr:SpoIIE family protein phosphatase [Bacteroidia bacterium]
MFKIRLNITTRIAGGFGSFILLTLVAFVYTFAVLKDTRKKTDIVVEQVIPSLNELKDFNLLLQKSKTLIAKWYYSRSVTDNSEFRDELKLLITKEYSQSKKRLNDISKAWNKTDSSELQAILKKTEATFALYQREIMDKLNSLESYDDPSIMYPAKFALEDAESSVDMISKKLNILISKKTQEADTVKQQMFQSINFLETIVKLLGLILVIGGIIIAYFTIRSIVVPIMQLKNLLLKMGKGIIPQERFPDRQDEIGEMGRALNILINSFERTTEFAKQTGAGNFDALFQPLSEHDTLGHALIRMRDELAENERVLEQKVIERTEEVVRQKKEIEYLFTQVTDSIKYAKRIQEAILPPLKYFQKLLPDSFILYKPKDIVSGDFYWIEQKNDYIYVAAVDCTGHGVPGAFMSIIGSNLLKDIINNTSLIHPAEILDELNIRIAQTLHSEQTDTKDGMDLSFIAINKNTNQIEYATAMNPICLVKKNEIHILGGDRFPIGKYTDVINKFTNHFIQVEKGDIIYMFSDGYADQFGGPKGKKLYKKNFYNILLEASKWPIEHQKFILEKKFLEWKGDLEQIDDILVIGIKF